jgi:glucose/arabinose dehydrogenase
VRRLVLGTLALLVCAPAASAAIRVPDGVRVSTAARVPWANNLTFDRTGGMWVTSSAGAAQSTDGVWFRPRGGRARHVAKDLHLALGLAWYRDWLYVSHATSPSNGRVTALGGWNGKRFSKRRVVVPTLRIGRHAVDSIAPGYDNRLYVGVGSVADHSGFPGRIVSFRPDGSGLQREATGLRNPYGLAFFPGTSRLLVTDNARDDLGPFKPPEELNVFDVAGGTVHFGFPSCWSQGGPACRGKVAPLAKLPAHASSDGLAIAEDWAGGGPTAFIAQNGSSFGRNPTGRDIQMVRLGVRAETAAKPRRFAGGFRQQDPLGAAIGPDGSLFVTLLISGKVLRFTEP